LGVCLARDQFDCEIISKCGLSATVVEAGKRAVVRKDSQRDALFRSLEASLCRLQQEQIQVYLLHWWDEITPIEDIVDTFMEMVRSKKIQTFGFSNLPIDQVNKVIELSPQKMYFQYPFSLAQQEAAETLQFVHAHGHLTMAYGVLSQGLLTGKFSRKSTFDSDDRRHRLDHFKGKYRNDLDDKIDRMRDVVSLHGVTCTHASIAWACRKDFIDRVIVGCKNPTQYRENYAAASESQMKNDLFLALEEIF
jgi:aryl-alcohol dehydrogenase-like predicted oxidoreductase